jgi:hypothetical protein
MAKREIDGSGLESQPATTAEMSLLPDQFKSVLQPTKSQSFSQGDIRATFDLDGDRMRVKLESDEHPRVIRRTITAASGGKPHFENLPDFGDAAQAPELDPVILNEASDLFLATENVDRVYLEIADGRLEFESRPRPEDAECFEEGLETEGEGATLILPKFLDDASAIAKRNTGVGIASSELRVIEQGPVRFRYNLTCGSATYWVGPSP